MLEAQKELKIVEDIRRKAINEFDNDGEEKKINSIFKKYGVVEQLYHGNCLIGEHCHRLLLFSSDILDEIKTSLISSRTIITERNEVK